MKKSLLLIAASFLTVGCGPSQDEYDALLNKANDLESQLKAKDKEIYDLKQTPSILLATAKGVDSDDEKETNLSNLINKYPTSSEAKEASALLKEINTKRMKSNRDYQMELSLSKSCAIIQDTLPNNFKGANIPAIIKTYESANIKPKNEFETTVEYKSRVEAEIKNIGFNLQCTVFDSYARYDADKRGWNISIQNYRKEESGNSTYILNDYNIVSSEKYIGSNSFGVSREIYKKITLSTGVAFSSKKLEENLVSLGKVSGSYSDDIFIPMNQNIAKSLESNDIKFLIQYKWAPDYITGFKKYERPTIDSPTESEDEYKAIYGDILNILIFNQKTGEILKRTKNIAKKL